jgi:hypothetical protein
MDIVLYENFYYESSKYDRNSCVHNYDLSITYSFSYILFLFNHQNLAKDLDPLTTFLETLSTLNRTVFERGL